MAAGDSNFKLHFQTTADTSGTRALTQSTREAVKGTQELTSAAAKADAWVKSWNADTVQHASAVKSASDGQKAWASSTRLTIAELERLQRAQKAASINAGVEAQRQEKLAMGATWKATSPAGKGGAVNGKTGGVQSGGKGMNAGMAALEASRAIEDAQYGIGGVINNIPGVLQSLNVPMPWIAGISIGVVALTQLTKLFKGLGDDFKVEALQQKLEGLADTMDQAFDRVAKRMKDDFTKDIKAAQAAWTKEMEGWKESQATGAKEVAEKGASIDSKQAAGESSINLEGQIAGGGKDVDKALDEQRQAMADRAQRQKLDDEAQAAIHDAQRAAHGINAARANRAQGEADIAAAPKERAKIVADMKGKGILSDQEKILSDLDATRGERADINKEMDKAGANVEEARRSGVPSSVDAAERKAEALKKQFLLIAERQKQLEALAPQAQAEKDKGQYTFENVDASKLQWWQRKALKNGQAELGNVDAGEQAAKGRVKQAEEQEKAAEKSVQENTERQQRAKSAIDKNTVDVTNRQIEAGELPTAPPEEVGAALGRQRQESGRDSLPMLPPSPVTVQPPRDLDLGPQQAAFETAMNQNGAAVQETISAMASMGEKSAAAMESMKAQILGRVASIEARLDAAGSRGQTLT